MLQRIRCEGGNAIDIVVWRFAIAVGVGDWMWPRVGIRYGALHIDLGNVHAALLYDRYLSYRG
ncbi:MAG: hypothetical protein ACYTEO_19855 [Planctomycetota bacterium]|jgi:hypothetical protein